MKDSERTWAYFDIYYKAKGILFRMALELNN